MEQTLLEAGADDPTPPTPPRVSRWGKFGIGAALLLLVIVVAGFIIHVPYSTISPGEAVRLTDLVKVDGARTYPDQRGDIRLLFVRERDHVALWQYLYAQFDDDTEVFKEKALNPSGQSPEELNVEATAQMTQAKIAATKVALEAAGYRVKPATEGVVVLAVMPSKPAGKALREGDVLLKADGVPLPNSTSLRDAIGKHKAGERVVFDIERDGKPMTVPVGVATIDGRPSIGVFVSPRYDFPVKVNVDTEGIGGPSGGLAMTLAILDDLTPGNLTGGKRVAVTGTIDDNGNVGEIGGIEQKAVAARAAGAKVFIVPKCTTPELKATCEPDLRRAIRRAGSKVKVVPVATFGEALEVLHDNGGDPVQAITPAA